MPDYELDVPQTAWQRRHFIPDQADCAVKAFSGGGESSTENELLPASHKVLFSSQIISKIFLFNGILLLHQKSGSQAKNSVNPLQSAPIGTTIT